MSERLNDTTPTSAVQSRNDSRSINATKIISDIVNLVHEDFFTDEELSLIVCNAESKIRRRFCSQTKLEEYVNKILTISMSKLPDTTTQVFIDKLKSTQEFHRIYNKKRTKNENLIELDEILRLLEKTRTLYQSMYREQYHEQGCGLSPDSKSKYDQARAELGKKLKEFWKNNEPYKSLFKKKSVISRHA